MVRIVSRSAQKKALNCPYCRDELREERALRCAGCATVYHPPCADELRLCAVLGCLGVLTALGPSESLTTASVDLRTWLDLAGDLLRAAFCLSLVMAFLLVALGGKTGAHLVADPVVWLWQHAAQALSSLRALFVGLVDSEPGLVLALAALPPSLAVRWQLRREREARS